MRSLTCALLLFASICFGQTNSSPAKSALDGLNFLSGDWKGTGSGEPGSGTGAFSFHPDLGGHILVRKSYSEYPASKDRPAFRHDDLINVFEENGRLRAIYFDSEGHVIHYSVATEKDSATFLSEGDGPRFRLTYRLLDPARVNIKFEMAPPGSDVFKTYLDGTASKQ